MEDEQAGYPGHLCVCACVCVCVKEDNIVRLSVSVDLKCYFDNFFNPFQE